MCADCAEPMHSGPGSLPQGQARCLACRRKSSTRVVVNQTKYMGACSDCGGPCWATRCRACYDTYVKAKADPEGAAQRKRDRALRQRRDLAAPGLTTQERRNLRAKWVKQSMVCTYCDALATQVDHVIPLALGGTNYEGNLTPSCAPCNMRKSDSLLIEWRHKVRVKRQRTEPPPLAITPRPRRKRKRTWAKAEPMFNVCVCGVTVQGKGAWCSARCYMRTRYRRQMGIPDNAPRYARAS
jgi:hypothetical protein